MAFGVCGTVGPSNHVLDGGLDPPMVRGNFGRIYSPLNSIADGALFPSHWIALQTEHSLPLFARWRCGAVISVSQVRSQGTQSGGGHKWACPRLVYSTRWCGLLSNYFDFLLHLQVVISRGDLMKQAEKLLDDLGWSKAVLEIQYEHEVQYIHDILKCCKLKKS